MKDRSLAEKMNYISAQITDINNSKGVLRVEAQQILANKELSKEVRWEFFNKVESVLPIAHNGFYQLGEESGRTFDAGGWKDNQFVELDTLREYLDENNSEHQFVE